MKVGSLEESRCNPCDTTGREDTVMTTRELIPAEMANVPEENWDELDRLVQQFTSAQAIVFPKHPGETARDSHRSAD